MTVKNVKMTPTAVGVILKESDRDRMTEGSPEILRALPSG